MTRPDEFIWFHLPTEVWKCNWLLAIDGSDAFHAVVLHATSQAVTDRNWTGGSVTHSEVPLGERRMKIIETSHGIRAVSLDADNKPLHHGHFTVDVKGHRFVLPCLTSNPIAPAPGAAPYTARLWQFAIDEHRTQIVRYAVWRARTDEERERATRCLTRSPCRGYRKSRRRTPLPPKPRVRWFQRGAKSIYKSPTSTW